MTSLFGMRVVGHIPHLVAEGGTVSKRLKTRAPSAGLRGHRQARPAREVRVRISEEPPTLLHG